VELSVRARQGGRFNYVVQMLARHEGPHRVSEGKLELLRAAQRWIVSHYRMPLGTSGGRLMPIPGGHMQTALIRAIGVGPDAGGCPPTDWSADQWRAEWGAGVAGGEGA
jgi:hypothetical protein